jgi:hypothetical protein
MNNWAGQWAGLKKKENLRKAKNNGICNAIRRAKSVNCIEKMPIISAKGYTHILSLETLRVVHNMIR